MKPAFPHLTPLPASGSPVHALSACSGPHVMVLLDPQDDGSGPESLMPIARQLAQRGYRVVLAMPSPSGEQRSPLATDLDRVPLDRGGPLGGLLSLARLLKRQRPDALIAAGASDNLLALGAVRLSRHAVVTIALEPGLAATTADTAEGWRGHARNWLMRRLYPGADAVVAASAEIRAELENRLGRRCPVLLPPEPVPPAGPQANWTAGATMHRRVEAYGELIRGLLERRLPSGAGAVAWVGGRPPMRVGLYLHDMSNNGIERMCLHLIPLLAKQGVQVEVLLHHRQGELLERLPPDIPVTSFETRRTLYDLRLLVRELRSDRFDLVLSSLDHNNVVALLARLLTGDRARLIICQHNALSRERWHQRSWTYRLVPLAYRLLSRLADRVVAVSEGVAENLVDRCGISRDRISVIHNPVLDEGFDARAAEPVSHRWFDDPQVPVFVTVGRLVAQKDHATLLRAFALYRQRARARLLILGRGELEGELRRLCSALGLDEDVEFLGHQPNVLPYLRRASAVMLTSRYESFGNVVVEALGCGTPVISTNCSYGPSEILDGGRYGVLVPVGDVQALADAWSADLRQRFDSETLRQRARAYTAVLSAHRYWQLFDTVLQPYVLRSAPNPPRPFGLKLDYNSVNDIARMLLDRRPPADEPGLVVTPNIDHIAQLRGDPAFREAYRWAVVSTCDGFPVHYYARLLGFKLLRVTGCDLVTTLMRSADEDVARQRWFFVVDSDTTAAAIQAWGRSRQLQDRLTTTVPPLGFINNDSYCRALAQQIREARPTLLLMAVGAPRSEIFVSRYRALLPRCWAMCIGQAVKTELNLVRRAPPWLRLVNLEWAWRIAQEPRRLAGRYVRASVGFLLAIREDNQPRRRPIVGRR